ncbi:MAG TPA: head GIN domain-containing protein [Chitinophagaceae bacterium]|nr:head GIN domain-containing protein [Chitinophagaceae bacterium]
MKKLFSALLLMVSLHVAQAQQTLINDENAEKRNISAFNGISVAGGIDIYITQGNEDGIAVSATETKYRDRIRTEVRDGILSIWYENDGMHWPTGNKKLKAYISFKNISSLKASGASDVKINGVLKAASLDLKLVGASDIKGVVDIEKLTARISGASDMMVKGKVGMLDIEASGASDVKDFDLVVQTCEAQASGASDIKITVEKEISANATGASDIVIRGNGVIKKMSKSGASSIKKS